jgi:hypothetical protein
VGAFRWTEEVVENGEFDDQPKYTDVRSWRKWLQTLHAEILRFAQDDNDSAFSAACEAQLPPAEAGGCFVI